VIELLDKKGYVMESDHPYAKKGKFGKDKLNEMNKMLKTHGYDGQVESIGKVYGTIDVYGLYDESRISFEDALSWLDIEGKHQLALEALDLDASDPCTE